MNDELIALLNEIDRVEALQRKTGENFNEMNLDYNSSVIPKIPSSTFFDEGPIFINKHHRFSYTPAHTHSFIEMNYVLRGNSSQKINGEQILLKENQLILMDKEVIQQIDYVGEKDLILNFLIQDTALRTSFLNYLVTSENPVTNFFTQAALKNENHNRFLIFDLSEGSLARNLLTILATKFFRKDGNYQNSLNLLLGALLIELTNSEVLSSSSDFPPQTEIIEILHYINEHYTSITLYDLADHFGYNKNYLSNMLKAKTGITFQEMLDQKRLSEAKKLLQESDTAINEIAEMVGYKSVPSLFKLFQHRLHITPNEYRQRIRKAREDKRE